MAQSLHPLPYDVFGRNSAMRASFHFAAILAVLGLAGAGPGAIAHASPSVLASNASVPHWTWSQGLMEPGLLSWERIGLLPGRQRAGGAGGSFAPWQDGSGSPPSADDPAVWLPASMVPDWLRNLWAVAPGALGEKCAASAGGDGLACVIRVPVDLALVLWRRARLDGWPSGQQGGTTPDLAPALPVPEPATIATLAAGLIALAAARRSRR